MKLETCHDSIAQDIKSAKLALFSLLISSYCRENVTDCVVQSWYALTVSTGSLLFRKFTHTSCE